MWEICFLNLKCFCTYQGLFCGGAKASTYKQVPEAVVIAVAGGGTEDEGLVKLDSLRGV